MAGGDRLNELTIMCGDFFILLVPTTLVDKYRSRSCSSVRPSLSVLSLNQLTFDLDFLLIVHDVSLLPTESQGHRSRLG